MEDRRFFAFAAAAVGLSFAGGIALAKLRQDGIGAAAGDPTTSGRSESATGRRLTALTTTQSGPTSRRFESLARSREFGMFEKFSGYLRLIHEAKPDEMAELLTLLQREIPEDIGREPLIAILARRWAEADPEAAFAALLAGQPRGVEEGMDQIVAVVAAGNPRAAWAQWLAAGDETGDGRIGAWGAEPILEELLTEIGTADPALAFEMVIALEEPGRFLRGINGAMEDLASRRPAEFLDAIDRLPIAPLATRRGLIQAAIINLAASDVEAAKARLDQLDPGTRRIAEFGIACGWARTDPQAALEWAGGMTGSLQQRAFKAILEQQAAEDPAAAAAALSSLPSPESRTQIADEVALSWYRTDPDAALAWVRDTLEGTARQASYATLLRSNFDQENFDRDFERLREMATGADIGVTGAHDKFATQWATRDPRAAAEWAITREVDPQRLLAPIATVWAQSDPAALGQFAATLADAQLRAVAENALSPQAIGTTEVDAR